jgi:hypothetical protein
LQLSLHETVAEATDWVIWESFLPFQVLGGKGMKGVTSDGCGHDVLGSHLPTKRYGSLEFTVDEGSSTQQDLASVLFDSPSHVPDNAKEQALSCLVQSGWKVYDHEFMMAGVDSILVFAGLRVRCGVHTGLHSAADIS